jgi:hypothetical protein
MVQPLSSTARATSPNKTDLVDLLKMRPGFTRQRFLMIEVESIFHSLGLKMVYDSKYRFPFSADSIGSMANT